MADDQPIRRLSRLRALQLRAVWRAFLLVTLGLFAASVPVRYEQLEDVARGTQGEVARLFAGGGLLDFLSSPSVYPLVVLALEVAFVGLLSVTSMGIAWGRSDQPTAMFFSAVFVGYPVWVTPTLDALDLAAPASYVANLTQALGLLLALCFFLLFPDGRFVPRGARFGAMFWASYCLLWGLFPDSWFSLINPITATVEMFALLMLGWTTGMLAQYTRYRRSADSQQRRQTKWVLVVIAGAIIGYGSVYMTDVWLPDEGRARILYNLFGVPTFWLLALPMPIAITGAMIRHNLFDFTAVINRTLVYASLTAVLAGAYFGLSVLIGALIPVSENSPLVVAFSTLVVVTLFRPLRERIQRLIDQRFYRSKYDAARLVEKFGQRLRHEHDLGALTADLSGVVTEAMRPAHVSLWIPREDRRTDSSA